MPSRKRCTAFLISDFIDPDEYKKALQIANRKHDVVAIQVYDSLSTELCPIGVNESEGSGNRRGTMDQYLFAESEERVH